MTDPHHHDIPNPSTHHVHETAPMHDPVDQWHDHTADEKPQHAHADVQSSGLVLWVGIALAAIIAISSLVVFGFYSHYNTERMNTREVATKSGIGEVTSPALITRNDKGKELGLVSSGGQFPMLFPNEKDPDSPITKQITFDPIDKAADAVIKKYSTPQRAQGN